MDETHHSMATEEIAAEVEIHPIVKALLSVKAAPQGSKEWHDTRDKMLTASDVAAAIGANPYQSPAKLLRKKLGDDRFVFKGNAATRHGNENEEVAAQEYERRTGHKCYQFGLIPHPLHTWLGGSPDRITSDGILVEIKCPLRREIKHEIPSYYLPQVQVLLEITNLETCHFVQFRPASTWNEMELDILEIRRDRGWFRSKLPIMQKFRETWVEAAENGGLSYLDRGVFGNPSGSSGSDEDAPSKRRKTTEVELDAPFLFLESKRAVPTPPHHPVIPAATLSEPVAALN